MSYNIEKLKILSKIEGLIKDSLCEDLMEIVEERQKNFTEELFNKMLEDTRAMENKYSYSYEIFNSENYSYRFITYKNDRGILCYNFCRLPISKLEKLNSTILKYYEYACCVGCKDFEIEEGNTDYMEEGETLNSRYNMVLDCFKWYIDDIVYSLPLREI